MKNIICLSVICLVLVGCAQKTAWSKPGFTAYDFENDWATCSAQAFSVASGNLYQIAIVRNYCIEGKGWRLVNVK
jgi:hypothetical protein